MKNHVAELIKIGLSEQEAAVYVALLGLGRASVQEIAAEAGLKRPTAYLVLDELRKKGFALKEPHTKRTRYVAKDPEQAVRERLEEIQKVAYTIPELKAIQKSADKVNVLYFEGLEGVQKALTYNMDVLINTTSVGFFAKADEIKDNRFLDFLYLWNDQLAKHNISFRGIVPEHPSLDGFREKDKQHYRSVKRVSPEKYDSNISIEATESFVRIALLKQMQVIIIESPEAAKTVKQIFELLWERLE